MPDYLLDSNHLSAAIRRVSSVTVSVERSRLRHLERFAPRELDWMTCSESFPDKQCKPHKSNYSRASRCNPAMVSQMGITYSAGSEREGFEPPVRVTVRRFSKPVPSATRPPL